MISLAKSVLEIDINLGTFFVGLVDISFDGLGK